MEQGRRSRLIIRKIDPLSVLKFSVLIYLALYAVFMVAGVVLWGLFSNAGLRGNIESFVSDLIASEEFTFEGEQLFRASLIGGGIMVVAGTCANVLMIVLYNLISDVVGGLGISVEERVRRRDRADPPVPESGSSKKSDEGSRLQPVKRELGRRVAALRDPGREASSQGAKNPSARNPS